MAGKDIAAAGAAFTSDGDTGGVGQITIGSTTPFRAKARAMVSDGNSPSVEVIIQQIVSATVLLVKLATPQPAAPLGGTINGAVFGDQGPRNYGLYGVNYGGSSMAAYTVAQSARIDMPQQLIVNEPLP